MEDLKRLEELAPALLVAALLLLVAIFSVSVYLRPEMWTFTKEYRDQVEHLYVISATDGKVLLHATDNDFDSWQNGEIHWKVDNVDKCLHPGSNMRFISKSSLGLEVGDVVRDLNAVVKAEDENK